MKMTEKMKRYVAVGSGVVVCVGLIAAISLQFTEKPVHDDYPPEHETIATGVVVDPNQAKKETPSQVEKEADNEQGLMIKPETKNDSKTSPSNPSVDKHPAQTKQTEQNQPDVVEPRPTIEDTRINLTSKPDRTKGKESPSAPPIDNRPAQTGQTQQSIQPDVVKPKPPSEDVLTDSTRKPDGTKVNTPVEPPVQNEAEPPTKAPQPQNHEPHSEETRDGLVYLPGFGWVKDTGEEGIIAEDMYENGNKIGIMD